MPTAVCHVFLFVVCISQGHVDVPAELERIRTRIEKVQNKMATSEALMQTKKFRRRAAKIQQQEKDRVSRRSKG